MKCYDDVKKLLLTEIKWKCINENIDFNHFKTKDIDTNKNFFSLTSGLLILYQSLFWTPLTNFEMI